MKVTDIPPNGVASAGDSLPGTDILDLIKPPAPYLVQQEKVFPLVTSVLCVSTSGMQSRDGSK